MEDLLRWQRHAYTLANRNGILLMEVYFLESHAAAANSNFRSIQLAPIDGPETYCIALHEMGHLSAPGGSDSEARLRALRLVRNGDRILAGTMLKVALVGEERAAWDWAHANALEWTTGMEMVESWAYGTYRDADPDFLLTETLRKMGYILRP